MTQLTTGFLPVVHHSPVFNTGLSSLLVSNEVIRVLKHVLATTQGLLIGLWYATFSIRYLVVGILDNLIIERRSWLICEGVKVFLILVSLVLFSCVSSSLPLPTARRDSQCAGND